MLDPPCKPAGFFHPGPAGEIDVYLVEPAGSRSTHCDHMRFCRSANQRLYFWIPPRAGTLLADARRIVRKSFWLAAACGRSPPEPPAGRKREPRSSRRKLHGAFHESPLECSECTYRTPTASTSPLSPSNDTLARVSPLVDSWLAEGRRYISRHVDIYLRISPRRRSPRAHCRTGQPRRAIVLTKHTYLR